MLPQTVLMDIMALAMLAEGVKASKCLVKLRVEVQTLALRNACPCLESIVHITRQKVS